MISNQETLNLSPYMAIYGARVRVRVKVKHIILTLKNAKYVQ